MESLLEKIKNQPLWVKIIAIICAIILSLVTSVSFTSCSRSVVAFKGNGELQYIYHGQDARVTIQPE